MDTAEDQAWAWQIADEHKFKMKLAREKLAKQRKKKPMANATAKTPPLPPDPQRPVTVANWIAAAIPPLVENRYMVWVRQGGSILDGRIATFWYYPNSAVWEPTFKLEEGEQVDMWADVMPPFWQAAPGPTNLDRPTVK